MPRYPDARAMVTLAAALLLTGCFRLSRESPTLQRFVLSGGAAAGGTAPALSAAAATGSGVAAAARRSDLTLGLRRMDLATYLATPDIVVRQGVNRLITSQFHRWGEDLGRAINRVVATHLDDMPAVRAVEVAPWQARAQHDYLVQLHVMRFEGVVDSGAADGRVHVQAGWDIIRPLDGRVLIRGSTDERGGPWRAGDYGGLVSQLDAALVRVARDISSCLGRFSNDSTPPQSCTAEVAGARN